MNLNKKELQEENEALRIELEDYKKQVEELQSKYNNCMNDIAQNKKINCSLLDKASDLEKRMKDSQNQAAEYKKELDNLSDTKTVINKIMDILRSPHNDYQRVVNELNDRLSQEKSRADALDQELRNIQYDIQQIKFLDGKVQAYEAMFRVNPVRAAWGDIEPGEMPE